jgi:hypothetical protein
MLCTFCWPLHLLTTRESHYMRSWSLLKRTLLSYREQVVWVGVLQVRGGGGAGSSGRHRGPPAGKPGVQ